MLGLVCLMAIIGIVYVLGAIICAFKGGTKETDMALIRSETTIKETIER